MNRSELTILIIMRLFGISGLLAIPAVFFPFSWMASIHNLAGLGEMPNAPIVLYLARSLSAFYALFGTVTLFITLDIQRNRAFVSLWATILAVMLGIDVTAGMPLSWTASEGPPTFVFGLIVLWLQPRIGTASQGY